MSKIRIQVTIRDDIVKWMDKQIGTRKYASRSHAIEYAVLQLIQDDKTS
jgi:Arc/MetJ-type ribon-helix-helix transcriptional regulator